MGSLTYRKRIEKIKDRPKVDVCLNRLATGTYIYIHLSLLNVKNGIRAPGLLTLFIKPIQVYTDKVQIGWLLTIN